MESTCHLPEDTFSSVGSLGEIAAGNCSVLRETAVFWGFKAVFSFALAGKEGVTVREATSEPQHLELGVYGAPGRLESAWG